MCLTPGKLTTVGASRNYSTLVLATLPSPHMNKHTTGKATAGGAGHAGAVGATQGENEETQRPDPMALGHTAGWSLSQSRK